MRSGSRTMRSVSSGGPVCRTRRVRVRRSSADASTKNPRLRRLDSRSSSAALVAIACGCGSRPRRAARPGAEVAQSVGGERPDAGGRRPVSVERRAGPRPSADQVRGPLGAGLERRQRPVEGQEAGPRSARPVVLSPPARGCAGSRSRSLSEARFCAIESSMTVAVRGARGDPGTARRGEAEARGGRGPTRRTGRSPGCGVGCLARGVVLDVRESG